ncbi:MAG: general secretion pathway protein GspB [Planctomycetota bacterium]
MIKPWIYKTAATVLCALASGAIIWGQTATPPPPPSVDGKQPEQNQPGRVLKDDGWYAIILNGERVGSRHSTVDEITVSSQESSGTQKAYAFLQEAIINNPITALPYTKLTEEAEFSASDMSFIKSTLRMTLVDKREITLKGSRDGNKMEFSTTVSTPVPSGEPVSEAGPPLELAGSEVLYSEQALGLLLIANNWSVNQTYSLKLINSYNPNNLFTNANLMIKEKTTQRIMEVPTEGYICSMIILDPASSVDAMEYFIGLNGVVLKQSTANLSVVKIPQEQYTSGLTAAKRIFQRKGRIDPFVPRLTAIGVGVSPETDRKPPEHKKDKQMIAWLTEAREQLQLMRDIYDKTPADERDKLLEEPYKRILVIYENVNATDDIKAKNEMEEIRAEAERTFGGAAKIYAEAKHIRDEAKNVFEGGMALGLYRELPKKLARISELADRKELKNTEYYSKVKVLLDEVTEWARRAKVIEEFFATRPGITGIIYYMKAEEVKLSPLVIYFLGSEVSLPVSYYKQVQASSVMIGTKVYKEGDKITDDLTIKTIHPNTIIFNYKNEEISLEYKGR